MAKIKNFWLQGASGRVGDIVYKTINGNTYACSRPHFAKSNDPATLRRREKFALTVKLAKCINSIPDLKYFWNKARNGKMSTHNLITKFNYDCVSHNEIIFVPKLTSDSFPFRNLSTKYEFSKSNLSIEYSPIEYPVIKDTNKETYLKVVGIIHFSKPYDADEDYNSFLGISSACNSISGDNNISIDIPFDDHTMMYVDRYSECKLYFAFVSVDKNNIPVNSVSTFTVIFKGAKE